MKQSEIIVGQCYHARVSGKVAIVRVDAIRKGIGHRGRTTRTCVIYDVTNVQTDRKLVFRSVMRFRSLANNPTEQGNEDIHSGDARSDGADNAGIRGRVRLKLVLPPDY